MTDPTIRELESEPEWRAAHPVMRQLRTHLDEDAFVEGVREMAESGYRLFALEVDGEIVALAGAGILTNLYYGRHAWVYELVVDGDHRSRGYGAELLAFVEQWAEERGCELVALSSGLQRTDAHRFYEERMEMERASYVFKKTFE
jgi:GNAT superfamily N-acetyltransferase